MSKLSEIPYSTQWIDEDDIQAVVDVLRSPLLTQGPKITEFEEKVAKYCGAKHAVAVNSGTAALHIACCAAGITAGDEVITSPITFVASANCVLYCGGKPVFADVRPDTIDIDPEDIRQKITQKTKAIIPVHFSGNPCEMEQIQAIAKENGLIVIEDAAHAVGAEYKDTKVGSGKYSDMTTLSFHPVKNLTTGEGGMVLTNNDELYEKLKFYRSHGITRDPKYLRINKSINEDEGIWYYEMHKLGFNYRITDIQCALGLSQLNKLDSFIAKRREIAAKYDKAFGSSGNITMLKETFEARSAYHLYVIQVENRKDLYYKLRDKGIIANVHYIPVYYQPYYRELGYERGLCPNAEVYYQRCLSIPIYPKLTDTQFDFVVNSIKESL
ncbi:UDP-4-amino-4,6-dideoxy-N-acetyl-beta-L-altrosamine transaminase [Candidatus Margulisiibacteriota bacterium]